MNAAQSGECYAVGLLKKRQRARAEMNAAQSGECYGCA